MFRKYLLALVVIALFPLISCAQSDSFWNGGDGNWSSPANWSDGVPDGWFHAKLMQGSGNIVQDMSGLELVGLTIASSSANLVLDQSLSISGSFDFNQGVISGFGDLNLLPGSVTSLNTAGVFMGEGVNGGGTFRIQGVADISDSFTSAGFFEISGDQAIVGGTGDLNLNNAFTWDGGIMTGSGTTHLNQGALISNGTLDRTLESRAGLIVTGSGLTGTSNAIWHNIGDEAIFKISGDQHLTGEGTFHNQSGAFLKKTGGEGTSIVEWDVFHEGNMILVEQGELSFRGNTYLNSQLMVTENGVLDLKGTTTFGPNVTHAENGTLKFSGGSARFDHTYHGHLDTVLTGTSSIVGSGDIHFHRDFQVNTSSILGTGTLNLHGDSRISMATLNRTTHNFGTLNLNNSLITANSGDFTNHAGGAVRLGEFNNAFVGNGQFRNQQGGQLQTDLGSNSWIEWQVENNGKIGIDEQSTLSFRDKYVQSSSGRLAIDGGVVEFRGTDSVVGGRITGNGEIQTVNHGLVVEAAISPGPEFGMLHFLGDIEFNDSTIFDLEIGSGHVADLIVLDGNTILDGQVAISSLGNLSTGAYELFNIEGNVDNLGLELNLPNSLTGDLYFQPGIIGLNVTSIPEPTAAGVLALLLGITARRRR